MKELVLLDYDCKPFNTGIDLDKLEDILLIIIEVISGDEIAHIVYNNGDIEEYDSGSFRQMDFNDGSYSIYQAGVKNDIDEWLKRKDSYEYLQKEQENETDRP